MLLAVDVVFFVVVVLDVVRGMLCSCVGCYVSVRDLRSAPPPLTPLALTHLCAPGGVLFRDVYLLRYLATRGGT